MVRVWKLEEANERKKGPTEIRTRVTGIRTLGDNQLHYRTTTTSYVRYKIYTNYLLESIDIYRRIVYINLYQVSVCFLCKLNGTKAAINSIKWRSSKQRSCLRVILFRSTVWDSKRNGIVWTISL